MVYIHLSSNALSQIPKHLQKKHEIITVQQERYVKYSQFKTLSKTNSLSLHKYVCKSDIISELDMRKIIESGRRTPQEKRMIEEFRNKHEYRMMNSNSKQNSKNYYYGNISDGKESVKELTESMSFGVTFIFTFFMAGVTGYYFALYFFHFQTVGCLVVALLFIFLTIFVETWLFIIKQGRVNKKIETERKRWEVHQGKVAQHSLKTGIKVAKVLPGQVGVKQKKD